jgi:GTP1/Obg family GTP-binding protein
MKTKITRLRSVGKRRVRELETEMEKIRQRMHEREVAYYAAQRPDGAILHELYQELVKIACNIGDDDEVSTLLANMPHANDLTF